MNKIIKKACVFALPLLLGLGVANLHAETDDAWGERALNLQTSIDNDAPFAETSWVGTHNSNSNNDDDSLWDAFLNQSNGISKNLGKGIRQMQIDVHYSGGAVRVCHNNIMDYGECIATITGNRKFKNALQDIADFIDENPGEVLLVKFDFANSAKSHKTKVVNKISQKLDGYLLRTDIGIGTHGDYGSYGATYLPVKTLTKARVLAEGANVVLLTMSGVLSKSSLNDRVFYGNGGHYKSEGGVSDMNEVSDADKRSSMYKAKDSATKGDKSNVGMHPSDVLDHFAAGFNILETYGFAGGGGWDVDGESAVSSKDVVWSWDRDSQEPDGTDNCAKLRYSSDRFRDANCDNTYYAACRKLVETDGSRAYDDWILTSSKVTFANAEAQCLTDGAGEYFFATPRNKPELDIVVSLRNSKSLSTNDIWINYENVNGTWIADIGEVDDEMYTYCDEGGTGSICSYFDTYMDLLGLTTEDLAAPYVDDKPSSLTYSAGDFTLNSGEAVYTQNRKLIMQTDGNLVIYSYVSSTNTVGGALWSSGTNGSGAYKATFQGDGNFVVYSSNGAKWSSGTASKGKTLNFQGDGNLVIRNSSGTSKWASGSN